MGLWVEFLGLLSNRTFPRLYNYTEYEESFREDFLLEEAWRPSSFPLRPSRVAGDLRGRKSADCSGGSQDNPAAHILLHAI
ncbi:hypothetical protein cyc_08804 [Cyclospora cayetanensis]|uniref:Uncharacterized protein n=1 Tax=Cyclospora cayetanensis TaxID=88456 RepID=A0A1D3CUH4_9EIME|nr:hypothetical protein cyc_08804 [Cyclospora cayetanensis]